jgi:hypothetical protein
MRSRLSLKELRNGRIALHHVAPWAGRGTKSGIREIEVGGVAFSVPSATFAGVRVLQDDSVVFGFDGTLS